MSFWDEWFKRFRKGPSFFPEMERLMEEMEKEMAEVFKDMQNRFPEDEGQVRRLPDGRIRKEYGPFIYGYSVKMGPDGKPIIREFGNMKPGFGEGRPPLNLQERREPLVDILEGDEEIKVIAELPGVDKDEIQLYITENTLTINVDKPQRKFYIELELPVEIEAESAKSNYLNGILETTLKKRKKQDKGRKIKIE
jgi:HSP20 family protein